MPNLSCSPRDLKLNTFGQVRKFSEDEENPVIGGHGAVYYDGTPGTEYDDWGVILRLEPGCADMAISEGETWSFFNHNENILLGSKVAGTMSMFADEKGVQYRTIINLKDQDAKNVHARIERGDCRGSSMMFRIQDSRLEKQSDKLIQWITKISPLYEMGPVVNPAMKSANSIAMDEESGKRYAAELREKVEREARAALAQRQRRARKLKLANSA
jgi:HK97 family phage prohead protease